MTRKHFRILAAALLASRRRYAIELEVEQLRKALKVAREYVKATEGQLVTRPNIVTKDRELCDAALSLGRVHPRRGR